MAYNNVALRVVKPYAILHCMCNTEGSKDVCTVRVATLGLGSIHVVHVYWCMVLVSLVMTSVKSPLGSSSRLARNLV